jgi:hypothetical protein
MKRVCLLVLSLAILAGGSQAQTTIFSDNMTNFPTGWTLSPTAGWTKSATKYNSASYSAYCDNVNPYAASQNNYMTRSVSLSGYTSATLKFYIWQYTEASYDYVYLQYYSGTTWTTAWSRAGSYQAWAQISATIPTTATQVRFWFKSDGSVQNTGAYIDDVVLTATASTTTPTLAISSTSWAPAAAGVTSSAISVTNSATTSVIAYTVSSSQTWLTVSSASGSTPGSFTMTASANTGSARSATVTVTATTAGVTGSPKTITVSQAAGTGGDTYEPNGTAATAYGPLVSGTTYNSYIYSNGDIDYYKLTATTSGTITATLKNLPGDYDLYLYNSAQTQVAKSELGSTSPESLSYSAAAGTYYLKVIGYSGAYSTTVAYALKAIFPSGAATPTLAISSTSWAPAAAGATSSAISVTNSGSTSVIAYTVASNQTWLTVSSASGNTPGSFTMTATANTGTTSRSAAVTVTATTAGVANSPQTVTVTQPAPGTSAYEWTIMVFLNGDNNLEEFGMTNFAQMAAASQSSGKYRVIVQFDRATGYDATNGDWTTTKRFNVTPGMLPTAANQISDIGEADMGNPATLSTFANWAIDNYPANHYFLVFWDHGGGWTKGGKGAEVLKDFSNDNSSGNSISVANGEFATAMAAITSHLGRKLDIIGWDCCLMAMAEVFDVSKDYADVAVASEETEAGTGWNYTPFLNALNSNPTISALELGKAQIVGTGTTLDTQSEIDLTKIANLNTKVSTFADQLMAAKAAGYSSAINSAQTATQGYAFPEYRDLYDFASRINSASVPAALKTAATDVMSAVTAAVYYNHATTSYSGSHGISIYNPLANGSSYNTSYNSLPFAANTHWDEYIKGQTSALNEPVTADPGTDTRFGRNHPLTFELAPCMPNPVVKYANLSFQLKTPAMTSLKIYNLSGQLVKTMVDAHCEAGWHDLAWDLRDNAGRSVSTGVYLYTLESGASHDSKRMIVVR